ncbi:MAG: UTP--glucose-1-phosphate uridylyltransferase GalU, partial [Pseudomonadales bacterium]|nr:UTP--glucose-1-phosphate uridylyltransferase GalU [Pseudomonadales bacterium]
MNVKKCMFPAAGYGTRFLPATKSMPKEMLPIVNRPLIEFGVEEACEAGMTDICVVTGRGKRALEDHFDTNFELEHQIAGSAKEAALDQIRELTEACTFSYTRQRAMRGLGDAVLTGRALVGNEPFGLVLADDLCLNLAGDGVLKQMKVLAEIHDCSVIAVMDVPDDQVSKYGIVVGEAMEENLLKVSSMVEKPAIEEAPSNLAVIGRYVLGPEIFAHIENTEPGAGGEIQLTDALNALAKSGKLL